MNCSEFKELLDDYALLDAEGLRGLEAHALICAECGRELEFYRSVIQTTASLPIPDPPEDLIDKINARIDAEPRLRIAAERAARTAGRSIYRYGTIAACLAVGLAVGLNSGRIKDCLFGGADSGIISETTISETAAPVQTAEASAVSAPSDEKPSEPPAIRTTEIPRAKPAAVINTAPAETAAPAAKVPVKAAPAAAPAKTAAPVKTEKSTLAPVVTEAVTEAPTIRIYKEEPIVKELPTENVSGRYTIAHGNYYIPETETAQAKETDAPTAEEYEIKKAGYQIAQGNYSGNVKEAGGVSSISISDKIIVAKADADAAAAIINELGIPSTNGFYTTVSATFTELLARLDAEGLDYTYSLQYSSGDKIVFKLVMK